MQLIYYMNHVTKIDKNMSYEGLAQSYGDRVYFCSRMDIVMIRVKSYGRRMTVVFGPMTVVLGSCEMRLNRVVSYECLMKVV